MDKKKQHLEGGRSMMYDASLAVKVTKEGTEIIKDFKEQLKQQKIEDLAWELFQEILGLRFKNELSVEQKKKITDTEEYQQYLDRAKRVYEKREKKKLRAVHNKKYPVIDVPATGNPEWAGGAYCLCFVYSKYHGNFVLKGYYKEVQEYLKKNYTHYFCNKSLWYHGGNRDIWEFWKEGVGIFEPHRNSKSYKGDAKWKFQVREYNHDFTDEEHSSKEKKSHWFKRMPHRWIPEFDNF